jgi:hypothetical protein
MARKLVYPFLVPTDALYLANKLHGDTIEHEGTVLAPVTGHLDLLDLEHYLIDPKVNVLYVAHEAGAFRPPIYVWPNERKPDFRRLYVSTGERLEREYGVSARVWRSSDGRVAIVSELYD